MSHLHQTTSPPRKACPPLESAPLSSRLLATTPTDRNVVCLSLFIVPIGTNLVIEGDNSDPLIWIGCSQLIDLGLHS